MAGTELHSIAEVSASLRITQRSLRFYEQRGLIAPVRNNRDRLYSRRDLDRIALIVKLKKFAFTLSEIKEMLPSDADPAEFSLTAEQCQRQIAFLEGHLASVNSALAELRQQI